VNRRGFPFTIEKRTDPAFRGGLAAKVNVGRSPSRGATTSILRPAVFIAEFVALAVMSIAVVTLVDRSQAAARREANALEIENRLFKVRHLLNQADGALRGFILTRQQSALDDHLNDKLALSLAIKEFLSARQLGNVVSLGD
jgi:hypothetical protein